MASVPQQSLESVRSGSGMPATRLEPLRHLARWASANAIALVLSVGSLVAVLAVMAEHARVGKDRAHHS
jgi:hypothetical protein